MDIPRFYSDSEEEVLAVSSKVRIGQKIFHIPMMDFRCDPSPENLSRLKMLLVRIGQSKGVILLSGRSYHFYGAELLNQKDYSPFLGNCGLLKGFVDERYIPHRLIDGCCILRILAGGIRTEIPKVVAIL